MSIKLHNAIRANHSSVVNINGNTQETIVATDINNNKVNINWTAVNSWTDPNEYKYKRAAEYPSIKDKLDDIYHNGVDGWKTTIKAVKDKYPKE